MPMSMSGASAYACASGEAWRGTAGRAVPVLSLSAMGAAHSTGGGGWRLSARIAEVLLAVLLAAAPALAAASAAAAAPAGVTAPSGRWMRVERRIESGYFQQDSAGLTSLAATLRSDSAPTGAAGDTTDEEWRGYYAALLAYRLALLAKD